MGGRETATSWRPETGSGRVALTPPWSAVRRPSLRVRWAGPSTPERSPMRIEVKGRNLQVTDELRDWITRRFDKVDKQVSEQAVLDVEVADERVPGDPVTAEVALRLKGTTLRAKDSSKDAKSAVNL